MTVKRAWKKIAEDYKRLRTLRELDTRMKKCAAVAMRWIVVWQNRPVMKITGDGVMCRHM